LDISIKVEKIMGFEADDSLNKDNSLKQNAKLAIEAIVSSLYKDPINLAEFVYCYTANFTNDKKRAVFKLIADCFQEQQYKVEWLAKLVDAYGKRVRVKDNNKSISIAPMTFLGSLTETQGQITAKEDTQKRKVEFLI
jgi:hypothetical protein